jgi:heme-degrading monooxygenase HmoA
MSPSETIEQVVLPVISGRESEFEVAFQEARQYIERASGFRWLRLARGVERRNCYLLLVGWESVTDHEHGFRQSADYENWRNLLHRFYEPFPKKPGAIRAFVGRDLMDLKTHREQILRRRVLESSSATARLAIPKFVEIGASVRHRFDGRRIQGAIGCHQEHARFAE